MAISMTGYGRGEYLDEKYHFTVEAKSVNNRYLDVNIRLPRRINYLEEYVRQYLKKFVTRGKVDIYIKLELSDVSDVRVGYDPLVADGYMEVLREISEKYALTNQPTAIDLARLPDVIRIEENPFDDQELKDALAQALERAFVAIKEMREQEGERLKTDILQRCGVLECYLEKIEACASTIESEYREKLMTKMTDILSAVGCQAEEQRIVQEAAIIADKASITEELVRFKSHIIQIKEVMRAEAVGRKMDFILQEMNREVNTIGSKSTKLEITNHVVELKSELEKIREQVQNIE